MQRKVIDATSVKFSFTVMGCIPYIPLEEGRLKQGIEYANGKNSRIAFQVHLGDIKNSKPPCLKKHHVIVDDILKISKVPVFVIPGENEWNSCDDPDKSWILWEKYFNEYDQKKDNGKKPFSVARQFIRHENFSFVHHEVLFIGLNLVGGRVHDEIEWINRMRQNVSWIEENLIMNCSMTKAVVIFGHAAPALVKKKGKGVSLGNHYPFFSGLRSLAEQSDKYIVYIHADNHEKGHEHQFLGVDNLHRQSITYGGDDPGYWFMEVKVDFKNSKFPLTFCYPRKPSGAKDISDNACLCQQGVAKSEAPLKEINARQAVPKHSPTPAKQSQGDYLDKLEKLGQLRANGVLSEDEFQTEKAKILS